MATSHRIPTDASSVRSVCCESTVCSRFPATSVAVMATRWPAVSCTVRLTRLRRAAPASALKRGALSSVTPVTPLSSAHTISTTQPSACSRIALTTSSGGCQSAIQDISLVVACPSRSRASTETVFRPSFRLMGSSNGLRFSASSMNFGRPLMDMFRTKASPSDTPDRRRDRSRVQTTRDLSSNSIAGGAMVFSARSLRRARLI